MYKTIIEFGGSIQKIMDFPEPEDTRWTAFNPSIAVHPAGGYGMTIRSSNYTLDPDTGLLLLSHGPYIMTRNWFMKLDEDLKPVSLREIIIDHGELDVRRGIEDLRLFLREDGWYFTGIMMERHTRACRVCLYKFDESTSIATFLGKLETPTPREPEKNWGVPDIATPEFDYIYSMSQTYKNGKIFGIPGAEDGIPGQRLRGSTQLLLQEDGSYLGIMHKVSISRSKSFNPQTFAIDDIVYRDYTSLFVRYNSVGKIIETSDEFIFERLGIEVPTGIVEHGNELVISYGKHDESAYLARIPKHAVVGMLVSNVHLDSKKSTI